MELKGERLIPAPIDATWAALNDPEVLKNCVVGCDTLERTAEDAFQAQMAVKIGPVSARFKGSLKLTDVNPPTSYTIHFEGQGASPVTAKVRPTCCWPWRKPTDTRC